MLRTISGQVKPRISKEFLRRAVRTLTAAVILCMLTSCGWGGENEGNVAGTDISYENINTSDADQTKEEAIMQIIKEEVTQEKTEGTEASEESGKVIALQEYYNANCLGKVGKVFFVDLTGDDEDEMIVLEKDTDRVEGGSLWGEQKFSLSVYQCAEGGVREVYHADAAKEMFGEITSATGINYYLCVEDGSAEILLEQCADLEEQVSTERLLFDNSGTEAVKSAVMTQDEFKAKRRNSILLLDSFTMMTPAWNIKQELEDYESVLECRKEIAEVIRIAEASEETVLDYSVVSDGEDNCIFAVTGEIQNCRADIDYRTGCYEGALSVWALYDGQARKLDDSYNFYDEGYWMGSEIYQFGREQHYFFETGSGGNGYLTYAQHKYCFDDHEPYRIEDSRILNKGANGEIQMKLSHKVEELNGNYLSDIYGEEILATDSIDIFFHNRQYMEYAAEMADRDILEKYENYKEVLQAIVSAFMDCSYIGDAPAYLYGMMDYSVQRVELDHVRQCANGVYYLNYKVYGRRLGWDSLDFFDQYSEECDVWAYAVLESAGNQLEFKKIVFGKKGEFSTQDSL